MSKTFLKAFRESLISCDRNYFGGNSAKKLSTPLLERMTWDLCSTQSIFLIECEKPWFSLCIKLTRSLKLTPGWKIKTNLEVIPVMHFYRTDFAPKRNTFARFSPMKNSSLPFLKITKNINCGESWLRGQS